MEFDRAALRQKLETASRYASGMTESASTFLAARGIARSVAEKYMLGTCDDIHSGWLSIPYLRGEGVIHFNFRNLSGGTPKYASPGKKHLYNTAALESADLTGEIAITEGELDAIIATECYGIPAVGIPGATQWTGNKHWRELFRGYQRVWMLADPDEAGIGLASAILEDLPAARLVNLPMDVNDCLLAKVDIKELIR